MKITKTLNDWKKTMTNETYAHFYDRLVSGELKAGDKVIVERHPVYSGSEIHAQYKESKRTVRETRQSTDYKGEIFNEVLFKESKYWFRTYVGAKNRLTGGNRKPLRYEVIS